MAPEIMTDEQALAVVVGFLSPLVLAMLQQPRWSNGVRSLVTFLWAAVVSLLILGVAGSLSGRTWVSATLLVLVVTIATYQGFWKQTGVTRKIEAATSPGSGGDPPV